MSWINRVKSNLIDKSVASEFVDAILEWEYERAYVEEEVNKDCELCDHPHIRNIHIIRNNSNNNIMEIGSECIKKFIRKIEIKDEDDIVIDEREINARNKKSNR